MLWRRINYEATEKEIFDALKEIIKRIISMKESSIDAFSPSGIHMLLKLLSTEHDTQVYILVITLLGVASNNEQLHLMLMKKNLINYLLPLLEKQSCDTHATSATAVLQLQLFDHLLSLLLLYTAWKQSSQEACLFENTVEKVVYFLSDKSIVSSLLYGYSKESTASFVNLTNKKELVAKVESLKSSSIFDLVFLQHTSISADVKSNLRLSKLFYELDIYDTSSEEQDIHVSSELIKSNSVWPAEEVNNGGNTQQTWQDIVVTCVISPEYFYAIVGENALELVTKVANSISGQPEDKRYYLKHPPLIGAFVCGFSANYGYYRGQVIKVIEDIQDNCHVFALDYGFIEKVNYERLFLAPAQMGIGKTIEPQAILCKLKGVKKTFLQPKIAETGLSILVNLANLKESGDHFKEQNVLESLYQISRSRDNHMVSRVFRVFCNISRSEVIRKQLVQLGIIPTVLDWCRSCSRDLTTFDNQVVIESGLSLLSNTIFFSDDYKSLFVEAKGVDALLPLIKDSVAIRVRNSALKVLRVLVGTGTAGTACGEQIFPRNEDDLNAVSIVVENMKRGRAKQREPSGPVEKRYTQIRDTGRSPENEKRQLAIRTKIPDDEEACISLSIHDSVTKSLAMKPNLEEVTSTDTDTASGSPTSGNNLNNVGSLYSERSRKNFQQENFTETHQRSRSRSLGRPPIDDETEKFVTAKLTLRHSSLKHGVHLSDDEIDSFQPDATTRKGTSWTIIDSDEEQSENDEEKVLKNTNIGSNDTVKLVNTVSLFNAKSAKPYYVQGTSVLFEADETHELRRIRNIKRISANHVSEIVCGFLNNRKGGSIYFGIQEHGTVSGIPISRDDRDEFRIGVDRVLTNNIRPPLLLSQYDITHTPVVFYNGYNDPKTRREIEDAFVVEIKIKPCSGSTLYSTPQDQSYFRQGDKTVLASAQDRHVTVVEEKEEQYLKDIQALTYEINRIKSQTT